MHAAAAVAHNPTSSRLLSRLFHALLGSTLFGISAATAIRADANQECYMTEDIALSGYVAGVVLPLDPSANAEPAELASHVPVATPDGYFVDEEMDDAAYRAMLDDVQLQQFILVGGIEFKSQD